MRNDFELYIGGEKVDLSESTKILFNYKTKELTNPTIVKNSFSKTIELEKTDTNNKIFGHIWNLNRIQSDTSFNPSKRVDFVLMLNGELIESGYCKLDKIKGKYSVSLYGGLGDFFYNLMYDSATGEKKNLASLDYGYDLGFTINKDTLRQAWAILLDPVPDIDNKWKIVNFAPCYNGISDEIDADKVLINTSGFTSPLRKWDGEKWVDINGFPTTAEDNEYNLINGYGFAELPNEMNEWQMRELRSYLQRPVVNMRAIIEACCNPVNNGGYEVELDDSFFNYTNPYYRYSWLTLPMLNDLGGEITEGDFSATVGNSSTLNGWFNTTYNLSTDFLPNADSYSISFKFRISGSTDLGTTAKTSGIVNGKVDYGGYAVHIAGYDANGNEVAEGDTVWMTSAVRDDKDFLSFSDTYAYGINGGNVYTQIGDFNKISNGLYEWPNEITLNLSSNGTRISILKVKLLALANIEYIDDVNYSYGTRRGRLYNSSTSDYFKFDRYQTLTDLTGKYYTSEGTPVNSHSKITKSNLLSTEETPADYLIAFSKLFNLYFEKDLYQKKVYIKTQRNYYDGDAINIDALIDRSKDNDITPLSFDTKWYNLNYKSDNESEVEEKYYDNYGTQFGKQKVNTGYDFNAEAKDLLQSPFVNGVQVLESGKYYAVGQTDFWKEIPTFLFNNVTYKLLNNENDATEIVLGQPRNVSYGLINKNSENGIRYDAFPKVQFHNGTDTTDGKNVLLFFNGFQNIRSDGDYQPKYMLTDDVNEMFRFNDNKPCWLYTKSEYDSNGNQIAWEENSLPQFSRYTTVEKTDDVYYSWDFGRTKQFYVPAYTYTSADSTIYERYWKRYLTDLYDINTRIVDCYVKFDEKVVPNLLKHFYYFDESYWVISEITDYNPASYDTVKVKFVKVNDLQAYTDYSPAITPNGVIVITLYNPNIAASGGTVEGYVYVADGGVWSFTEWDNGLTPSITGGTGSTSFTLTVSPNTTNQVRGLDITAERNGYTNTAQVVQESGGLKFEVNPEELVFFADGGVLEITISNPQGHRWEIVGRPEWTNFSIMSGTASAVISVSATTNTTGADRSGTTVVYDYTDSNTYIVHMEQVSTEGSTQYLTVTQFAQYVYDNVPQTGGTILYDVRSTSPWTVVSDREYAIPLSSGGTGNTLYGQTLQVYWPENTSYSYRNAIFTFRNEDGYEVKVYKNQDGINLTNLVFDYTGETKSVSYDEGSDVESSPDWITVTDSGGTYYLEASENETGGERTGEVILNNGNGGILTINCIQEAGEGSCCELITSFRVIPTELYYDGDGGIQYFYVQNPMGDVWNLSGVSWGYPNIRSGNGSAIIALTVPANSGSTRFQYITVNNLTNSADTKQVYVEQGSGSTKTLIVNPQRINVSDSGGTYQVTVKVQNYNPTDVVIENHSYGIEVGDIHFVGDTALVDIRVPENMTDSGKTFSVFFTLNGTISSSVNIIQEAKQFYLKVTPKLINSTESGDTYTLIIETNDSSFIIE